MSRWDRRIERARELEKRYPNAAEMLRFYREIATFQSGPRPTLPALLDLVRRAGTPVLRDAATHLSEEHPLYGFFHRVMEQPRFERQAAQGRVNTTAVQPGCPFCFEKPLLAVLRPEGAGGRRTLLCGRCFTEWEFRRLLCPNCGEDDWDKLPVYAAPEFPHIRVEACDACRHYLKAVDLTRDGNAVPEVDEIAALPLDLWAVEQGYQKLMPNVFDSGGRTAWCCDQGY
jgi:FdhE protein